MTEKLILITSKYPIFSHFPFFETFRGEDAPAHPTPVAPLRERNDWHLSWLQRLNIEQYGIHWTHT